MSWISCRWAFSELKGNCAGEMSKPWRESVWRGWWLWRVCAASTSQILCSCWLLSCSGYWGLGIFGGGVGGDLGYPVPVAASAIERIFAVGIEGWMGVPPMTSTRKAC